MPAYDVVVVGLGVMGSATLYALAQRGIRVLGIDRFAPPHEHGSSHGESRVFRMAYFEDPAYVPLLRLALQQWRKLEAVTNEEVLALTGMIEAGFPRAPQVKGSLLSAIQYDLDYEVLSAVEVNRRFPAFSIPADWDCLFQPDGGVLFPEKAIRLFLSVARNHEAHVRCNTIVRDVRSVEEHVEVLLEGGEVIKAGSAVLSTGPWIAELLPELSAHLKLTRQPVFWFQPKVPLLVRRGNMPVFSFQMENDFIYGFPDLLGNGVKVASHLSAGSMISPEAICSEVTGEEELVLRAALERLVPAAAGGTLHGTTCIYTRAPDEHFVLGIHPDTPKIVIVSACSGHGFKFGSLFGEVIADLATQQGTDIPIDLFSPSRLFNA